METKAKKLKRIESKGIKSNSGEEFMNGLDTAKRDGIFLYFDRVFFK
jgi:hypothetical protein